MVGQLQSRNSMAGGPSGGVLLMTWWLEAERGGTWEAGRCPLLGHTPSDPPLPSGPYLLTAIESQHP